MAMSGSNSKAELRGSSVDESTRQPTWEEESKHTTSFMDLSDVSKLILVSRNFASLATPPLSVGAGKASWQRM